MFKILFFLVVLMKFSSGSQWTHRCRLHHPWPLESGFFDRTLETFDSPLRDPFNHPLIDSHWSDDLLFPSLLFDERPFGRNPVEKPPKKDVSNVVRFNVDVHGFSSRDLTLTTQGQYLLIQGYKTSCDFSSCYKRRYCMKKKLPDDIDVDTMKARMDRGTLQIEAQRQRGIECNIPLQASAREKEKDTSEQLSNKSNRNMYHNRKSKADNDEEEATVEVLQEE